MIENPIKIKKSDLQNVTTLPVLNKTECCLSYLNSGTVLSDLINSAQASTIKYTPVKILKIGNGSQEYPELKSIIILDNADLIIADKDGFIIDYITNSSPTDAEKSNQI